MALIASEIGKVTDELAPALAEGWIQKIYQPTDRTLVLEIRAPGRTHRLLISCHPETTRLHFTTAAFQNPPAPPPFCQFLRAHLQGARIDQVDQVQGDRIVQFALTAKEGPCRLVAQLTGKTSNLLVLDERRPYSTRPERAEESGGTGICSTRLSATRTRRRRPVAIQPGHHRIAISPVGCRRSPLLHGGSSFRCRDRAEHQGRDSQKVHQEAPPPH